MTEKIIENPKQYVLVEWVDSSAKTGWNPPDSLPGAWDIISGGLLVTEDEQSLILCQNWAIRPTGSDVNRCGEAQAIPKCAIVRERRFPLPKDFRP